MDSKNYYWLLSMSPEIREMVAAAQKPTKMHIKNENRTGKNTHKRQYEMWII